MRADAHGADGGRYAGYLGAAGADGRLGLATSGWVETPAPLELADVRTFSAGLTASGAITGSGEAYLWGTVYSYVMLYDENGDPAASVVDGPLVSYGSTPVRLYENAQALAFGDAFVLLLRADGTILAWGSNDHGQMADGDWTKAELADGDDEDEKDVVITESDQFVFPAVIMVPAESLRSTTARLFRLRRLRGFRAGGAGGGCSSRTPETDVCLLLGAILAQGSNDHGQMANGDWTKAELADSDDEEEKDVVITESDQFMFSAVIAVHGERKVQQSRTPPFQEETAAFTWDGTRKIHY